uniref:Uncharacterized protein n=1 Tax=Lotharella oceanica TaxID=641309 RepID=A0A7S2TQD4_9EUKA|mmetsp:Transcript_24406/g.45663  ORF Transcript_24406/g.45663 Transcript_24406/m.45663 type:complete len:120 (+) Transcript_24406:2-361(+)
MIMTPGAESIYEPDVSSEDTPAEADRYTYGGYYPNVSEYTKAQEEKKRQGIPPVYPPKYIPFSPENREWVKQLLDINSTIPGGVRERLESLKLGEKPGYEERAPPPGLTSFPHLCGELH